MNDFYYLFLQFKSSPARRWRVRVFNIEQQMHLNPSGQLVLHPDEQVRVAVQVDVANASGQAEIVFVLALFIDAILELS